MDTFKIISIIFMMIMIYQIYILNKAVFKDKVEGFEGTQQSLGGVDDTNAINTLAQIAKNLMAGGVKVPGNMTVDVLNLGNKFRLSGVGDAHGNDDWIRLFGVDNKGYSGGIAMNKCAIQTTELTVANRNILDELNILNSQVAKLNSHWNGNDLTVNHINSTNGGSFSAPVNISTGDSIPLRLITPGGNQSKILVKGGGKAARIILGSDGKIYNTENEVRYA